MLKAIDQGVLRLLYVSPETLLSPPLWERLCQPQLQLNGLILDEAHCLVQWGRNLSSRLSAVGGRKAGIITKSARGQTTLPIAAFTATADPTAQKILRQVLGLESPQVVRLNPHRPNLHLRVQPVFSTGGQRKSLILQYLKQHPHQAGLIYVRTRRDSETLAAWLQSKGYRVAPYHGGLAGGERRRIEADWIEDRLQFVVCTSAFGMGVNKPNTRWVVHYQAPCTITEYVQEVGRAGRDSKTRNSPDSGERTYWLVRQQRPSAGSIF